MDTCIIKTLSYFDIFDYPLTFSELKRYLCCEIEYSDDDLLDIISTIAAVQEDNGFYFLFGRHQIVEKRNERGEISIQKLAKAKVIVKILSYIPTIQYIGISGSLSMYNAAASDDIDLFIITRKNTLWMTRALVNTVLVAIRQKRTRNSRSARNKICPNMFVEEDKLAFTGKRKTLYTAHEIVQLKSSFDRGSFHAKLFSSNKWIKNFLPNVKTTKFHNQKLSRYKYFLSKILAPLETIFFNAQRIYMHARISNETVTRNRAYFHPVDRQTLILDMYEIRYERYKRIYEDNLWIDKDEARFYLEQKKIRILN